jgi:hypothetical protein
MSHRFFTSRSGPATIRPPRRPQVFARPGLEPELARWFPRDARWPSRQRPDRESNKAASANAVIRRVASVDFERVLGLKTNKKARGALVAIALVALAFLVSLVLS